MSDMIGTRHTFASYFAFAVDTILKVLWREGFARGPQELVRLTWYRIRRLERRFNALVAQWRAGTLPAVRAVRCCEQPGTCLTLFMVCSRCLRRGAPLQTG